MKMAFRLALLPVLVIAAFAFQNAPRGAGHWEGVLKAPSQNVALVLDLVRNESGEWAGSMSMPAQGAEDIPLANITVQGDAVKFSMLNASGPVIEGKLSGDGSAMSGKLSSGGESVAFELKRTGEGKLKPAPASTALSNEFEGLWDGTLEAGGQQLRLQVKLRNTSGVGSGTVVTIDQGNVEIPITSVNQNQRQLEFTVRAVNGSYTGTLSPDGSTLEGKWTQAGNSAPLVLKRAATR
jgi:hypothetical protein